MKSIGCWTWVFCPTCAAFSRKFRQPGKRFFSPPRCRPRSNGSQHRCCAMLSWWKSARRSLAETVTHAVYPVAADQKFDLLMALLERTNFDSVLIFCRTKVNADRVAHFLKHAQHAVAVLHSNRTQRERIEALQGFKSGKYEVMVATDIASRGLDIAGVSHVINYDVPEHSEDYVHRIGRTGRAQNVGDAFTLMSGEELPAVQAIEHFIGQKIPRLKLENFPYLFTALFEPKAFEGRKPRVAAPRSAGVVAKRRRC